MRGHSEATTGGQQYVFDVNNRPRGGMVRTSSAPRGHIMGETGIFYYSTNNRYFKQTSPVYHLPDNFNICPLRYCNSRFQAQEETALGVLCRGEG